MQRRTTRSRKPPRHAARYERAVYARILNAADTTVIDLARNIAKTDAAEFRNQYPVYADDITGETRKALDELQGDATRRRYDAFLDAMVYCDTPEFATAMATVTDWAERLIRSAIDDKKW